MVIKVILGIVIIFFTYWMSLGTPFALAETSVIEIEVSLENPKGELPFFPEHLEFVVGQEDKRVLDKPSPTKHDFTAKDLADAS